MKSKSLEQIYNHFVKTAGPVRAKHLLSAVLLNVVDQLELDKEVVTQSAIEQKLSERAQTYNSSDSEEVA